MLKIHPIQKLPVPAATLQDLKSDFERIINSPRRLAAISCLRELIDVLWKRSEIGRHNIEGRFLDEFARFSEQERNTIRDYVISLDVTRNEDFGKNQYGMV